MGKKKCGVAGCRSTSNRQEDVGVTFHQLPANLSTRAIWVAGSRVQKDDNNVKICSRHFRESDFKLVNTKYFLIKGCYPTIFPWGVYALDEPAAHEVPDKQTDSHAVQDAPAATETPGPAEVPKISPGRAKREPPQPSAAVEAVKKPPAESEGANALRTSIETALGQPKKDAEGPKKVAPVPGNEISAMDFLNVWHKAKIVEVDSVERELLIHFEEDNQQKLVDEWIPMDSSRLRPLDAAGAPEQKTPVAGPSKVNACTTGGGGGAAAVMPKYKVNEKILARWSDSRKFKATVKSILPNGLYEVRFDDGFLKTVKLKHMSKLKSPRTPVKRAPPLPLVNLVGGEEWYCQWVDDCPLGVTATLEGIPARVRIIEVEDARLPAGWKKYFSERLHGGSKWDIVIIGPCGRRFRGRQDIRAYIEETGNAVLSLADFDFAMHKKRAKEKGVYTYTENYRKLLKALYPSMSEIDVTPPTPPEVQAQFMAQHPTMMLEPLPEMVTRDWIMVDGMKVQLIDNLLRCPEEGCLKNFRKENLLKMHIKHYHEAMAKKISATPTMTDLAAKRQSLVEPEATAVRAAASPVVTDAPVVVSSPQKVGRPPKVKASPNVTAVDLAIVKKEEIEESLLTVEPEEQQAPSLLEQALNSSTSAVKMEESFEKVYPKATPITDHVKKSSSLSAKRKYVRKNPTLEVDAQRVPKKIKLEPLEVSSMDESLSIEIPTPTPTQQLYQPEAVAPVPQQTEYINEHGELIKIVRMRQEEIINCLCHFPEEDGLMIQCDLCLCWQHGRCNDIEKESQVPDKYVCYICRNPERGRQSMKYVHDQDWLLDGKLPRGTYHTQGTVNDAKRTETLKRVNTLTGNLLELKRLMHSLRVKINIADNKDHPKLYLWSKRWEATGDSQKGGGGAVKEDPDEQNGPKPEVAIDTRECQRRLMEHIRNVQSQLATRMDDIEKYVDEIEAESELAKSPEDNMPRFKQTIHMMMDDLTTMKEIGQC